MSFAERLRPATEFENLALERLRVRGWVAQLFGAGRLESACHERIKQFEDLSLRPSLLRWFPDLIACRDLPNGGTQVVLIDAKVTTDPNYLIETTAVDVAEIFVERLYTPTVFLFSDWKVITPRIARQRGRLGPWTPNGSGSAYLQIPKEYGRPAGDVFPIVVPTADVVADTKYTTPNV